MEDKKRIDLHTLKYIKSNNWFWNIAKNKKRKQDKNIDFLFERFEEFKKDYEEMIDELLIKDKYLRQYKEIYRLYRKDILLYYTNSSYYTMFLKDKLRFRLKKNGNRYRKIKNITNIINMYIDELENLRVKPIKTTFLVSQSEIEKELININKLYSMKKGDILVFYRFFNHCETKEDVLSAFERLDRVYDVVYKDSRDSMNRRSEKSKEPLQRFLRNSGIKGINIGLHYPPNIRKQRKVFYGYDKKSFQKRVIVLKFAEEYYNYMIDGKIREHIDWFFSMFTRGKHLQTIKEWNDEAIGYSRFFSEKYRAYNKNKN